MNDLKPSDLKTESRRLNVSPIITDWKLEKKKQETKITRNSSMKIQQDRISCNRDSRGLGPTFLHRTLVTRLVNRLRAQLSPPPINQCFSRRSRLLHGIFPRETSRNIIIPRVYAAVYRPVARHHATWRPRNFLMVSHPGRGSLNFTEKYGRVSAREPDRRKGPSLAFFLIRPTLSGPLSERGGIVVPLRDNRGLFRITRN